MIDKSLLLFLGRSKERYGELIFEICPTCDNQKWNFQVNIEKDVLHCWACGTSGRITKLLKDRGIYVDPTPWQSTALVKKESVYKGITINGFKLLDFIQFRKFLEGRGLDEHDTSMYHLMTSDKGPYKNKVIIPLYEGSDLAYFTARDASEKGKYYQPGGAQRKNLLLYYLGSRHRFRLYIVEGPFDAIILNKMGYTVCPLLSSSISKEQIEKIKKFGFEEVVVCLDGDLKKVAIALYERVQKAGVKTKIILIPGMADPNDLYTVDKEYLQKILDKPKKLEFSERVKVMMEK